MYRPVTKNEWWLCGVLLIQAICVTILEIYKLTEWLQWVTPNIIQVTVSYIVPLSMGILIFASVYEFILSLDAIHNKNNVLLLAICVCNACSFAYSVMNYFLMRERTAMLFAERYGIPPLIDPTYNLWPRIRPADILVPIITGLCTLILCVCVYLLHKDYSWAIYKSVHGSLKMRVRYLFYEIFLVLIKLLFYFLIGFILQYNLVYVHFAEPEYTLTMLLIPVAFIVMMLGIWVVQREKTIGTMGIIICYLALLAYIITRIIVIHKANTAGKDMMLLFAYLTLVLTLGTVACMMVCIKNFDSGFRTINRSKRSNAHDSYLPTLGSSSPDTSRSPSRLELD